MTADLRRLLALAVTMLMVGVLAIVPTASPAAAAEDQITGRLVLPPGVVMSPDDEIEVSLVLSNGNSIAEVAVGMDDLSFVFSGLQYASGPFTVRVTGTDLVAGGYYLGSRTGWPPAEAAAVETGDDVTLVLDPAAAITGTIRIPEAIDHGWTMFSVHAIVEDPYGPPGAFGIDDGLRAGSTWATSVDGLLRFRIDGLRAGERYKVRLYNGMGGGEMGYLAETATGRLTASFLDAVEITAPASVDLVPTIPPGVVGSIRLPSGVTADMTDVRLVAEADGGERWAAIKPDPGNPGVLQFYMSAVDPLEGASTGVTLRIEDSLGVLAAGYFTDDGWGEDIHQAVTVDTSWLAPLELTAVRGMALAGVVVPESGFGGDLGTSSVRVRSESGTSWGLQPVNADGAFSLPGLLPDTGYVLEFRDWTQHLMDGVVLADGTVSRDRLSAHLHRPSDSPLTVRAPATGRLAVSVSSAGGTYVPDLDFTLDDGEETLTATRSRDTAAPTELRGLVPGTDYWLSVTEGGHYFADGYYTGDGEPLEKELTSKAVRVRAGDSIQIVLQELEEFRVTVVMPPGYCGALRDVTSQLFVRSGDRWESYGALKEGPGLRGDWQHVWNRLRPGGSYQLWSGDGGNGLVSGYLAADGTVRPTRDKAAVFEGAQSITIRPELAASGPYVLRSSAPPALDGATKVGSVLTASPGSWSRSSASFRYEWRRDGQAIAGATSPTYALTASDLGAQVSVRVTASDDGCSAVSVTSAPTDTVEPGVVARTAVPTVSGTAKVGSTLKAAPGTWSVPGLTYRYQWLRDGSAIAGASRATYTALPADVGRRFSVRVTAERVGYTSATAVSATTGAVAKGSIVGTRRPTVSGTAKVGARLRATPGSWSVPGVTYRYQWLRNGSAIPSASGSTYSVRSADAGKKVSVRVTVSRTGYSSASAASSTTATVVKGPIVNKTRPTVSGTAKVGTRLRASPGSWSVSGARYSYRWLRNGSPIPSAWGSTYSVRSADAGKKITVRVTATRTGYSSGVATSRPTRAVRR